ncbi:hypothetical protein RvY_02260 [Ramazzottius varieornatus]|uniref:Uncharacterized protein n=1 Tax=Ramazzottius varieornatus TaxID=947166 RepID=A0A1D1UJ50_RAMVA|nr:hypothetical protein RvY_02260 [Ramazzottius varieornatus]
MSHRNRLLCGSIPVDGSSRRTRGALPIRLIMKVSYKAKVKDGREWIMWECSVSWIISKRGKEVEAKATRFHWDEESQVRLLKQYRTTMEIFEGTETGMYNEIFKSLLSAGMKLRTARAVQEKTKAIVSEFKASNRMEEWKSGDPVKRYCKLSKKKSLEEEKQARKDQKFKDAATFSKRKRRSAQDHELTPDPLDLDRDNDALNTPKRERTSYNHMLKSFLESSTEVKNKELQIKEELLAVERTREARLSEESKMKYELEQKRIEADQIKMVNDRKREELFANVMLEALRTLKKD